MPLSLAWEVVTETEPEWDDRERAKLLALATYEAGLCECGWHKDLTDDRSNHFTFDDRTCPVCKGTAQVVADAAGGRRAGREVDG